MACVGAAALGQRAGLLRTLVLQTVQLQETGVIGIRLLHGFDIGFNTHRMVAFAHGAEQRGTFAAHGVQHTQRHIAMRKIRSSLGAMQHKVGKIGIGFALVLEHMRQIIRQNALHMTFKRHQRAAFQYLCSKTHG